MSAEPPAPLARHLAAMTGCWPPPGPGVHVCPNPARAARGWDGRVHPVFGVRLPDGSGAVGVAPELADSLDVASLDEGVFRWSDAPADDVPALGQWVRADDPRLPVWLWPFGGQALVAFADDGTYAAGVGLKRHDEWVQEIAVGTDEAHQGKGLARRLVVTAARAVLDAGLVPTYLHDLDNHASAKVAEAAGFPDRGWRFLSTGDA